MLNDTCTCSVTGWDTWLTLPGAPSVMPDRNTAAPPEGGRRGDSVKRETQRARGKRGGHVSPASGSFSVHPPKHLGAKVFVHLHLRLQMATFQPRKLHDRTKSTFLKLLLPCMKSYNVFKFHSLKETRGNYPGFHNNIIHIEKSR